MIKKILYRIFCLIYGKLEPTSTVKMEKCTFCGKMLEVHYNLYGTSSGAGTCECGARKIIN